MDKKNREPGRRTHASAPADGVGHTKSRRFRSVSVGDRLLSLLRDLHARQAELRADDPRSRYVFVMPERQRKTDRGRYASTGRVGEPINRRTVSRAWHKAALQECATCRCTRSATPPPPPGCSPGRR